MNYNPDCPAWGNLTWPKVEEFNLANGELVDVSHLLRQARAGFEAVVMDEANRVFGQKAAVLDGIIVGGGGAELLLKELKQRYPNAISSDEPRMMVAEGFCRLGLLSLLQS
ncbi:hypothetical protein ACHMW6_29545 [Pseudoduganella sp. UC29_106]|uniref:hypothetical protein n=1 Tax=Pseudoduganella sp. UC29_106 TaxID=3374553 RepID=UPI003757BC07